MYKPGERIRLKWCGDSNIPIFLNNVWATVIEITVKGNLVVRPDLELGLRTINPNKHIYKERSN